MKEFTIEDFTINNDNSVTIEYYFYSELKKEIYYEDQIKEVFGLSHFYFGDLLEDFDQDDCIKLLKYFTREYAKKKDKKL